MEKLRFLCREIIKMFLLFDVHRSGEPYGSILKPILSIFVLLICQAVLKIMNVYNMQEALQPTTHSSGQRKQNCNGGKNIWNHTKKSSKIWQEQKTFIPEFFTAITEVLFLEGRLVTKVCFQSFGIFQIIPRQILYNALCTRFQVPLYFWRIVPILNLVQFLISCPRLWLNKAIQVNCFRKP